MLYLLYIYKWELKWSTFSGVKSQTIRCRKLYNMAKWSLKHVVIPLVVYFCTKVMALVQGYRNAKKRLRDTDLQSFRQKGGRFEWAGVKMYSRGRVKILAFLRREPRGQPLVFNMIRNSTLINITAHTDVPASLLRIPPGISRRYVVLCV